MRIRTSYLAAHATPSEYADRNGDYITEVVLPGLEEAKNLGLVDAVDGFCEGIAFSVAEIARVFEQARLLGLPVKLHAEQLSNLGGARLAASYGALSADHLEYLDAPGARALARAGRLRCCCRALSTRFGNARLRRSKSCVIPESILPWPPIATPGTSPLSSLLLAMNMAACLFGLTVEECIAGTTREAARALGLLGETGTLEEGKSADFAIWDVERPAELVYRIGFNPLYQRVYEGATVRA